MKSNVEDMETEMDHLRDHMDKVTSQCSEIDTALAPRRDKIRQLDGVHNLLKKLQFIFELPNRLQQCYNTAAYPQAVRYWARTTHLFEHYQHLSVFHNIETECRDIMNRVQQNIKELMRAPDATSQSIIDNTILLIQLKEDPMSLSKEYIKL
jgi:DNA repair ATPase RecN